MKKITIELIDGTKLEFAALDSTGTDAGYGIETETEEVFIPMSQIKIIRGEKKSK